MEEQKDLGSYSEDGTVDAVSVPSTGLHTGGEWVAQTHHELKQGGRFFVHITASNSLVPIATVPTGVEGFGREEGRANARLVAAAPELLEALCVIKNAYENDGPVDWSIRRSFGAIEKALRQ